MTNNVKKILFFRLDPRLVKIVGFCTPGVVKIITLPWHRLVRKDGSIIITGGKLMKRSSQNVKVGQGFRSIIRIFSILIIEI